MKRDLDKEKNGGRSAHPWLLRWLIGLWIFTLIISVVFGAVSFSTGFLKDDSYTRWIMAVTAFANFIATSFFSISIYNHNTTVRASDLLIQKQADETNRRAEAFRSLQFAASNYTIADFVDSMTIYEEYPRYKNKLKDTQDFNFYVLEQGINYYDVPEDFSSYTFLSVRIPFAILEGKSIGRFSIKSIKIEKEEKVYRFVPPEDRTATDMLIIYDEQEKRQEAVFNMIIKKDSDFYNVSEINPFLKIKFKVTMESLLGVVVNGVIELYFTNPEKIEKSGASKYKINSSQFEATGLPELNYNTNIEI